MAVITLEELQRPTDIGESVNRTNTSITLYKFNGKAARRKTFLKIKNNKSHSKYAENVGLVN